MAVASLVSFFFAHEDGVHGIQSNPSAKPTASVRQGVLTAYQVSGIGYPAATARATPRSSQIRLAVLLHHELESAAFQAPVTRGYIHRGEAIDVTLDVRPRRPVVRRKLPNGSYPPRKAHPHQAT